MSSKAKNPTVRPNPEFDASKSAESLHAGLDGYGCDKQKIIQSLCTISNSQRQELAKCYKEKYGKDVIDDIKCELSGDFKHFILALMEPPACYDAYQLHKAMAGLGTKESVLIEILTTRSNAELQEIREVYPRMYGKGLDRDIIGDTSGNFKNFLVALCSGCRDESEEVDQDRAAQDARKLYSATVERLLGTDANTFNTILVTQNFSQLRQVFREFQKISGRDIELTINEEFRGDTRDGYIALVKSVRNRPALFAELLRQSMVGLGTRDNDLIRLVVTRSEVDLADVRNQYQQLYHTRLESAISTDCSGAYKDGLIAMVQGY